MSWRWSASLTGARFHNEHSTAAFQDSSIHYWHVQTITIGELDLTVARGLRPGAGLELLLPLRLIRSRIRYEDVARQPITLQYPDGHHRNETPVRIADPTLSMHIARAGEVWNLAGRVGLSIPIGRTEPNPFALGRLGLPHEHFQFGSGTWDPVLAVAAGRELGRGTLSTTAQAHLVFNRNSHGFQAGDRFNGNLSLTHPLPWQGSGYLAFDITREQAEQWNGRLEEEGNLGRTDALLSLGAGHAFGPVGSLALSMGVPIYSKVRGEQGDQPLVFTLNWSPRSLRKEP